MQRLSQHEIQQAVSDGTAFEKLVESGPTLSDVKAMDSAQVTVDENGKWKAKVTSTKGLRELYEATNPRRQIDTALGGNRNARKTKVRLFDGSMVDETRAEKVERKKHARLAGKRAFGSTRAYREAPYWRRKREEP